MKTLRQTIQDLSYSDLNEIVANYEEFEKEGAIGDCLLRETATKFVESLSPQSLSFPIVLWMEKVAFECYRELANKLKPFELPPSVSVKLISYENLAAESSNLSEMDQFAEPYTPTPTNS